LNHGLKNDESLLPAKAAKDKDVEIEGKEPFDRYYYVDYLDKQINVLSANRRINLAALYILLGIGLLFLLKRWDGADADVSLFSTIGLFLSWMWNGLVGLFAESQKEKPLLDWLVNVGPAVPAFIATMQARWCVHGAENIRQLVALKELVRNSDNLTQDLRIRLHKILDQSLQGAEDPAYHATWLPDLYRRSKTAVRKLLSKPNPGSKRIEA